MFMPAPGGQTAGRDQSLGIVTFLVIPVRGRTRGGRRWPFGTNPAAAPAGELRAAPHTLVSTMNCHRAVREPAPPRDGVTVGCRSCAIAAPSTIGRRGPPGGLFLSPRSH